MNGSSAGAPTITTSSPGRICLFGEHQDYLGLPVIAAAIDLRVSVHAIPNEHDFFRISLPDISEFRELSTTKNNTYLHDRDYLAAGVNVLARAGVLWNTGYDVTVKGDIPLNSGASSSSALQVAWVAFLLAAAHDSRIDNPTAIARLAHQSEVVEFNSPGGMMDHFAAALGGTIWLDCKPPYHHERLEFTGGTFVLVDSGIPKDTNGVLGSKRRVLENLGIPYKDLSPTVRSLPAGIACNLSAEEALMARATLENRYLTEQARRVLNSGSVATGDIGSLLTSHHEYLSRNIEVSLPEIDRLIQLGLEAGALGGKINGSGCGGSFFLLCKSDGKDILDLYQKAGLRAWIVHPGSGVKIDRSGIAEAVS